MSKGKETGSIPALYPYLFENNEMKPFVAIPWDIIYEPSFQKLSKSAQAFYLMLHIYKISPDQRADLNKILRDYNKLFELGWTEQQIKDEAEPDNNTRYTHGYFCITMKRLELLGYSASHASNLKKELIENGFIKVAFAGKGKNNGWSKNYTVYQFSNKWRKVNDTS